MSKKASTTTAPQTPAQIEETRAKLQAQLDQLNAQASSMNEQRYKDAAAHLDALPKLLSEALGKPVDLKSASQYLARHIKGKLNAPFNAAKGIELSDAKKETLKTRLNERATALKAGTPPLQISTIANEIGCSEITVNNYAKRWNLTKREIMAAVVAPAEQVAATA